MLSDTMMLGGGRKAAYPIENSLLFRGGQYLSRTPAVAGNRKTWTLSTWVRRSMFGGEFPLFSAATDANNRVYFRIEGSDEVAERLCLHTVTNGTLTEISSVAALRDPTAWLHVVLAVDTAQVVVADRAKLYVNGVQQQWAVISGTGFPAQDVALEVNNAVAHYLGRKDIQLYYGQYSLADVIFVDGQALSPTDFAETDQVTGSWRPKKVTGIEFGANGFHLGNPWDAASLGADASGKGNTWTPSGFVATDVVKDSPTNVYATLSLVDKNAVVQTYNGNLFASGGAAATNNSLTQTPLTLPLPTSGKWFVEVRRDSNGSDGNDVGIGVTKARRGDNGWPGGRHSSELVGYYAYEAGWYIQHDIVSNNVAWATNTVGGTPNAVYTSAFRTTSAWYGVAFDCDNHTMALYENGVLIGVPKPFTHPGADAAIAIMKGDHGIEVNCGQKVWNQAVPAGFKALCTANLPASTGVTSGSFTGNANADGPFVHTGAVPQTLTVNGNAVTWGEHADKLATGFKIRSASASFNGSGTNTWTATYSKKPTVGPKGRAPANAQANP